MLRPADECAVIVVNYRTTRYLGALLDSIAAGTAVPRQVVVVNNEPAEAEDVARLASAHGARVIEAGGNLGFGAGCNLGARSVLAAGARQLLFVNPDVVVHPGCVETMLAYWREDPTAIISPVIHASPSGTTWFQGGVLDLRRLRAYHADAYLRHPDWITGCALGVPAEAWRELGGFDADYFLYWEDVDLSHRWRTRGGTLAVLADASVSHVVGGAAGGSKSAAYFYWNARNRLLFARQHEGSGGRRRALAYTPHYANELRRRGMKDRSQVAAFVRGTADGWRRRG